ncbi:GPH family glycoside/pentoside/hexuronide:cation symporter [Virgibacillus halotolerans]|uniref:MFS transporter n=1 Tax=Virgibacillus halotolerans TaxID=1071053 RepID=UPI0019611810|nr:glycoside-pentoside-hexuronide (GPH):cation symporter [Virgibacillus halotolerans]MBM7599235.1 GPH family glycoside/pentoside/hexuronide:cation symporter [Virgibacillus halotolerans]
MELKIEEEKALQQNTKPRKFGIRDEIGYAAGDSAGSFVNLYVDSFFLVFCTYVLGLSPFFMSAVFLIARTWDAINDPLIGSFPDRWKLGKSGDKFKPYIKLAMFPLAISGVLAYTNVSGLGSGFTHVWVVVTYILVGMSYTGTSMPFGSMMSIVTPNPDERTKLSRARGIGGLLVGGVFMSFVPLFIFNSNGDVVPQAFFYIAVIFGILSLLGYTTLLKLVPERVKEPVETKAKFNYKKVLKSLPKNRPLMGLMVATVGQLITITGYIQFSTYLFGEYYGNPQVVQLVMLAAIPGSILGFIVVPRLAKRFGKRNILLISLSFSFLVFLFQFLVPISNEYVFILLYAIGSVGVAPYFVLVWSLVSDCLDYHEYITGERNDGSLFSIYAFSRKIGTVIAASGASFLLGVIGYIAGNATQSPDVIENIRWIGTGIPLLSVTIQLIGIGFIFNLTKEKTEHVTEELKQRREHQVFE